MGFGEHKAMLRRNNRKISRENPANIILRRFIYYSEANGHLLTRLV
jgi:hypothetical protein